MLVVYSVSATKDPLSVLCTLVELLSENRNDVTVVDTSNLMYIKHSASPEFRSPKPSEEKRSNRVEEILKSFGAGLISLTPALLPERYPALEGVAKREIEEAAVSGAMSYARDDRMRRDAGRIPSYRRNLKLGTQLYFWLLHYLSEHPEIETVVIPNGRLADQRSLIEASKMANRRILYYEIGRATPKSLYLGPYRVHDRVGTQDLAKTHSLALSQATVVSLADSWLKKRTARNSETNPFSQAWQKPNKKRGEEPPPSLKRAVFFTSSADEFSALGPSWNLQEWKDQYEAFDVIASKLEALGVLCAIRIHPNLSNKSSRHFREEIGRIFSLHEKHRTMEIIWPNQPVDSYSLLKGADYVVVARSTIGLEASLLGKCVWTTTPTRYDQLADVKTLWRKTDVLEETFSGWNVNSLGAARYIAHTVLYDIPFSTRCHDDGGASAKGQTFGGRLKSFLTPQPLPHKMHLLRLEISTRLQKRIPASLFRAWFSCKAWLGTAGLSSGLK